MPAAGANIANAQGRPNANGTASSTLVVQPSIGAYVQDALAPAADTNYIGVNTKTAYATNVLGESDTDPFATSAPQPDWLVPVDDNAATGGKAQLVKNGATALVPTDKVTISAGVATKDNSTGTHNVFATVPANYFFWAVAAATT
jgi:hypothetical protein